MEKNRLDALVSAERSENVLNKLSRQELADFVAKAGKRANERLASQERKGQEYTASYQYVSSKMVGREEFTATSESGHIKFVTKTRARSRNDLLREAREIKGYLQAQTSTTRGLEETYQRGLDTFNKNNGTNLSRAEFDRIVSNEQFEHFKKEYGSARVVSLVKNHGYDVALKVLESDARTIREQERLIAELEEDYDGFMPVNDTDLPEDF